MSAEPRIPFNALPAVRGTALAQTSASPAGRLRAAGEAVSVFQSVDRSVAVQLAGAWLQVAALPADRERASHAQQQGMIWLIVASLHGLPSLPSAPPARGPVRDVLVAVRRIDSSRAVLRLVTSTVQHPEPDEPADEAGVAAPGDPASMERVVAGMQLLLHSQDAGVRWPTLVRERTRASVAASFRALEHDAARRARG